MKILCIDHEGGFGGSSRSLFYFIKELNKKNKNIYIEVWCCKDGPIIERYKQLNIKVKKIDSIFTYTSLFSLSRNLYTFLFTILKLLMNKRKNKHLIKYIQSNFDLVHFNHPNLFLFAIFIRKVNVPFIFHIRTVLENLYEGTPLNFINKKLNILTSKLSVFFQIKSISLISSGLVFISKNEKKSFLKLGGYGKSVISHNLFNYTLLSQKKKDKSLNFDNFKIAVIENYRWSRGTDRLLEIAEELRKKKIESVKFIVAGDMRLTKREAIYLNVEYRKGMTIENIAKERNLLKYFKFLGSISEPAVVMNECNMLLSLTRRAGPWGRSVLEAMHYGKPVIATGESCGFVKDNFNGFFIKEYTPKLLVKKILYLIKNKNKYLDMQINTINYIKNICDEDKNINQVLKIWQKAISKNKK
jgi:glycosyltransferase involved in cell wall biosynthesis